MAGAGAKKFPAFSKLASDDVNNYLADQVIMRFATTAARDAAFGGVGEPTLAEGMTAYIDNLNIVQVYDGSNWVAIANANYPYQNPTGLELVTSCTVTSSGGTAATASNGVITIGTANTTISVNNAFSALYDNYKIVVSGGVGSTLQLINLYMGTTVQTSGYWSGRIINTPNNGTPTGNGVNNGGAWVYAGQASNNFINVNVDLVNPFASKFTLISGNFILDSGGNSEFGTQSGMLNNTTSYTSFTLGASANLTGGTIRVYGYRN